MNLIETENILLRACMNHWTFAKQSDMLIEEMAELIVELQHERRGREHHVLEELADVYIMASQLALHYGEDAFKEMVVKKIDKTRNRLINSIVKAMNNE